MQHIGNQIRMQKMTSPEPSLHLSIIQADIFWEDIDRNLVHLADLMSKMDSGTDIIILPEMFSTGFSMNVKKLAEEPTGKTLEWMLSKSGEYQSVITGSIICMEHGKFFNRLYWVCPDGQWYSYDKRHLFSMAGENKYFEPGKKRLIVTYKGWRICPLICYDLRFPVWSRNNLGYDLLIYVANWPAARNHVWNILLQARAIENQCFVAGANRVGRDGENIKYLGESCIIHPKGYFSNISHEPREQIITSVLNMDELNNFRHKFPVLNDGDHLNSAFFGA